MKRPLAVVAAVAKNRVIGRDNDMPWRQSSDLKRFKAITWGKPLIVGRRSHEAIGRPLPGRETIVLTRDKAFDEEGVHVAHDVADALSLAEAVAEEMDASEIIVVGGGEIYKLLMPKAQIMHLTEIDAEPEGDVFFPEWDPSQWKETFREEHVAGGRDDYGFTFRDLVRVRSA